MSCEMCPHCRQTREMTLTRSTRSATGADGSARRIRTDSYHCATCRAFVRSEDVDEPPGAGGSS